MRYPYAAGNRQYAGAKAGPRALPAAHCHPPALARAGFTFTEVMFAVILLGIGFIMLAGMFPVAIQQTAQTQQETVGASLALTAVKQISQHATADVMPPTGQFADQPNYNYVAPQALQFREVFVPGPNNTWSVERSVDTNGPRANPLWKTIRGDLIFSEDPRYAFVPFYQRVPHQNVAKLIVIAVQNQASGAYEFSRDVITVEEFSKNRIDNRSAYATLEPRRLEAIISDGGPDVDVIQIRTPKSLKINGADPLECVGEGAFVVVSDDRQANVNWTAHDDGGYANGRIYRIGSRYSGSGKLPAFPNSQAWELVPGFDLASRLENLPLCNEPNGYLKNATWGQDLRNNNDYDDHDGNTPAIIYVIGRGQEDPTNEKSPYVGNVQDVAAYTTYINLK